MEKNNFDPRLFCGKCGGIAELVPYIINNEPGPRFYFAQCQDENDRWCCETPGCKSADDAAEYFQRNFSKEAYAREYGDD